MSVVIIFAVAVAVLLCGCSRSKTAVLCVVVVLIQLSCTTKYIPTRENHQGVEIRHKVFRDSIYIYDRERVENDTVYITRHVYSRTCDRDTVYISESDSVPYPVEVEVVREAVPMWSWWCLVVCVVMVCSLIIKVVLKFKR